MSHHESATHGRDARLVDRMLFFTDAVFAIVLTLLALELRPPHADVEGDQAILQGIADSARTLASYVVSFALGSAFWLAHLRTSKMLREWDWATAIVNLVHLLTVGLLPYAAGLLGQHANNIIAFLAYAVIIMLVSFTGSAFWLCATRDGGRLVGGGMTWRRRLGGFLRTSAIGWGFAACIALYMIPEFRAYTRYGWAVSFPLIGLGRVVTGKQEAKG